MRRPAVRSKPRSLSAGTADWRQENCPSPTSRKGSVKYSSGTFSADMARSNSSAETRRSPFSMAETVCLSLKPNTEASSSCDSLRSSRRAFTRIPMRSLMASM